MNRLRIATPPGLPLGPGNPQRAGPAHSQHSIPGRAPAPIRSGPQSCCPPPTNSSTVSAGSPVIPSKPSSEPPEPESPSTARILPTRAAIRFIWHPARGAGCSRTSSLPPDLPPASCPVETPDQWQKRAGPGSRAPFLEDLLVSRAPMSCCPPPTGASLVCAVRPSGFLEPPGPERLHIHPTVTPE